MPGTEEAEHHVEQARVLLLAGAICATPIHLPDSWFVLQTGRHAEAGDPPRCWRWDQVVAEYTAVLLQLDTDPAYGPARMAMLEFGRDLGAQPGAVAVLRERGDARDGEAANPGGGGGRRAAGAGGGAIVEGTETKIRAQLQEQAQQKAAQEAARRQEQASRPQLTPRRGPGMGM